MALTITTKPKKTKVAAAAQSVDVEEPSQIVKPELIDEFRALTTKVEKHDAKIEADRKRLGELKSQIVAICDTVLPAEESVKLAGSDGRIIEISAKPEAAAVADIEQAKKYLGTETFWKIAKVGITDLRTYLSKAQFESVTVTERTGTRRLKIID